MTTMPQKNLIVRIWEWLKSTAGMVVSVVIAALAAIFVFGGKKKPVIDDVTLINNAEKEKEKIVEEIKKTEAEIAIVNKKIDDNTNEAVNKIKEVLNTNEESTDKLISDFIDSWRKQ